MSEDPLLGQTLNGRYVLLEQVGSGGMGQVYRASQTSLDRLVAIKVLNPFYATRPNAVRRFNQEAKAASRLEHPNIVRVYDFGRAESGELYLAMELLRGESLKALLRRVGPLSVAQSAGILSQVCAALAAAHQAGVIHRDLKPDNIMLVPGSNGPLVKVLDFGIAKLIEGGAPAEDSVTRDVVGTPEYMAPEQILGEAVGPQTDLYAVGVNWYELLTGARPFGGKSPVQTYLAHLNEPCPSLPDPLPAAKEPAGLVAPLIHRLLAKERPARPASAAGLARLLERLAAGEAPGETMNALLETGYPAAVQQPPPDLDGGLQGVGSPQPGDDTLLDVARPPDIGAAAAPSAPAPSLTRVRQQRRDVVVVHVRANGGAAVGEALDIEDRLTLLAPLAGEFKRVAREHGAALLHNHNGELGALTAVLGAPVAREGDAVAALRLALAMRDLVGERGGMPGQGNVAVHCGVAQGPALVAPGPDGVELMGDVVGRAAALAERACAGQVLASEAVVQDCSAHARVVPAAEVVSGGGRAWVVMGLRDEDDLGNPDVEGVTTRMVGRHRQRATLRQAALQVAEAAQFRLVVLSGEAGVGKSRLMRDTLGWIAGAMPRAFVVRARAETHRRDVPYSLARRLVWGALKLSERLDLPELAQRLEEALGATQIENAAQGASALVAAFGLGSNEERQLATASSDPKVLRARAFEAFAAILRGRASSRTVVLAVEDVHNADTASIEWLQELESKCADCSLLVLASARPELFATASWWRQDGERRTHLELLPLRGDEARQLVGELLQRMAEAPEPLVAFLAERAEGNPFYAEELVKALVASGAIERRAEGWVARFDPEAADVLPRSVQALLLARVDALGEFDRSVIQAASTVGRIFWSQSVAALVGASRDRVSEALDRLEDASLVVRRHASLLESEQEYQFDHPLLREVTYNSLLRRVRRECHAAVADWLEVRLRGRDVEALALVARHAELAEDPARAFSGYWAAGEHAARTYANQDAVRLLDKALQLGERAGESVASELPRVAARLGEVLEVISRFADARRAYQRGLRLGGDGLVAPERAELARRAARALYRGGQLEEALQELAQLGRDVAALTPTVGLAVAADLGWLYHLKGKEGLAKAELEGALARWPAHLARDSAGADWVRARANALNALGTVHLYGCRWQQARQCYAEAKPLYEQAGAQHAAAACGLNLGVAALMQRELTPAQQALSSAECELERVGYLHGAYNARLYLARTARLEGRFTDAEALVKRVLHWAESSEAPLLAAEAAVERVEIQLQRRSWRDAVDSGHRAVELSQKAQGAEVLALALGARGRAHLEVGRRERQPAAFAEARRDLEAALGAPHQGLRRDEQARLEWSLADALLESRPADPERARNLRASSLRTLRALGLSSEAERLEVAASLRVQAC